MTRSHKRNNHIYLVKNTLAQNDEYWYGIFVALNAPAAKRSALHISWGKDLKPWSDELYKALEVTDAGITKELATNEPVALFFKQSGMIDETYRKIIDEIQKIIYIPPNRQKKIKTAEPLPDQITLFKE